MQNPKSNVLIVDDDLVYRFAAVRTIAATELVDKITECENGQEALNYLQQHASEPQNLPDIIFLDINMPVMNGWEFLKAFGTFTSGISKTIHIYLVTSSIDQSDVERSKEFSKVIDYIIKPVSKDTFAKILSTVQV